jgi:hypothetical protein
MKVDIEQVKAYRKYLSEVNDIPLEELQLFENGVQIEINPAIAEEWRFVGLCNVDFIMEEIYTAKETIYELI